MAAPNNVTQVQYGCGLSAPSAWVNFDASPTLWLQKIPLAGILFKKMSGVPFPSNVRFGDIVAGLPLKDKSCDAVYCSHVLEHLPLHDFEKAIANTFRILKPGGIFRLVMPDLRKMTESYLAANDPEAAVRFMRHTGMALEYRSKGLKGVLRESLGNARHQWLWDGESTTHYLQKAGFTNIRPCKLGDSAWGGFKDVEDADRFRDSIAIEAIRG